VEPQERRKPEEDAERESGGGALGGVMRMQHLVEPVAHARGKKLHSVQK
jgi:hypothetical protein